MCLFRGKRKLEDQFPHHNWIIILSFQLLVVTGFSIMTPSIYQFVTSPRTTSDKAEDNGTFWPGLGGSDIDYGWVVAAQSLFEAGVLPLTVATLYRFPFTFALLTFCFLAAVGGATYALAQSVWIAFAGRALMGAGVSVGAAAIHTYLGEMGTVMDEIREKQGKRHKKYLLYIAFSFTLNGGFILPYALTSIMAQFKDVNPYRWPGWSVTTLAAVMGISVMLFFTETRSLSRLKISNAKCSCLTGVKLSAQLRTKSIVQYLTYIFVIACGFVVGMIYAFIFTLITPILSDQFGFDVEYTSHFFIGVSTAYLCSSFIHLGAKIARMDNRYLLGLCLLLAVVGCALVGDWQSVINKDSCHSDFTNEVNDIDNGTSSVMGSGSGISNCSFMPEHDDCTVSFTPYEQCCQSLSSPNQDCFFNPKSRITGKVCRTCLCTCLSEQATINVYQFSAGVLFLSLSCPLGFVFASKIASDITPVETQGLVVSLVIGGGAVGRAVTPLWFVESYILTSRHTYLAMGTTAGCALVLLISLVFLFKHLVPITRRRDDNVVVKASSKLWAMNSDVSNEDIVNETVL